MTLKDEAKTGAPWRRGFSLVKIDVFGHIEVEHVEIPEDETETEKNDEEDERVRVPHGR